MKRLIYIPKTDVSQTQLDYSYKAVFQLYILFHTSLKKKKETLGEILRLFCFLTRNISTGMLPLINPGLNTLMCFHIFLEQ